MIDDQVEQIDVRRPQIWFLLGDVLEQEPHMIPDPQFLLGRVIEDVEGDFVAQALAAEEIVGGDLGQDLVQSIC